MMFAHVAGFCAAACFLSGFDASKIHAVNASEAECQPNDNVIALAEVAEAGISARALHEARVETSSLANHSKLFGLITRAIHEITGVSQKGAGPSKSQSDMCKTKDQCWKRAHDLKNIGKTYKIPDQRHCEDGKCKATGCAYNFAGEEYSAPGCYVGWNDCVYWNNDKWDQDGFNGWTSNKQDLSCDFEENEPCDFDRCWFYAYHSNEYKAPKYHSNVEEDGDVGTHEDCVYPFVGDYDTKGCYVYNSGTYKNCVFWGGTKGVKEDQTTKFIGKNQRRFCWLNKDNTQSRTNQYGSTTNDA